MDPAEALVSNEAVTALTLNSICTDREMSGSIPVKIGGETLQSIHRPSAPRYAVMLQIETFCGFSMRSIDFWYLREL